MKIYDHAGTPNAARIRIVLREKGLDDAVTFIPVNLTRAEQKQDWFLALNPIGKTPVLLLDDGLAISESVAITEYLDNLDGNPVLTGTTPREKAVIHMMHRRAEMMVLDAIDDYFHYGTPGLGADLRPWRMPDWADEEKLAWGARRGAMAVVNLPYFNRLLAQNPFLAGARFSLADITLYAAITFATALRLPVSAELTSLHAWFDRVSDLPSVRNRSGQKLPQQNGPG